MYILRGDEDSEEELASTQSSTRSTRSRRGQNGTALDGTEMVTPTVNGSSHVESETMEVEESSPKEISTER